MYFNIRTLSSLLGTALPSYCSYKAMEKIQNPKLQKHWFHYWAVYGAYSALDWIFSTILISHFGQLYDLLALIFIIYISVPKFKGSTFVYEKILAPFFRRTDEEVDYILSYFFLIILVNAPGLLTTFNGVVYNIFVSMIGPSSISYAMDHYERELYSKLTNAVNPHVFRKTVSDFASDKNSDNSILRHYSDEGGRTDRDYILEQDESDEDFYHIWKRRARRTYYVPPEDKENFIRLVKQELEEYPMYQHTSDSDDEIFMPLNFGERNFGMRRQSAAVEEIVTVQPPTPAQSESRRKRRARRRVFVREGGRGGTQG